MPSKLVTSFAVASLTQATKAARRRNEVDQRKRRTASRLPRKPMSSMFRVQQHQIVAGDDGALGWDTANEMAKSMVNHVVDVRRLSPGVPWVSDEVTTSIGLPCEGIVAVQSRRVDCRFLDANIGTPLEVLPPSHRRIVPLTASRAPGCSEIEGLSRPRRSDSCRLHGRRI